MGNVCMKPKVGDNNKANPKDFKKLINFEEEEKEFAGTASTFYSDYEDTSSLVPYLKANPQAKYLIESFLECPKECNSMKCGQCTAGRCNNMKLSLERCESLKKHLQDKGCKNHIEIKAWGCTNPDIKKDMMKMSPWKEPPPPEDPATTPAAPVPVLKAPEILPPLHDEAEYHKRLALLDAREKAIKEAEEKAEAEKAQVKLQEAKLEQEKTELEEKIKAAAQAERKALMHETQAAIALAEAQKRIADAAEQQAIEQEELEKAKKKFEQEIQEAHDAETKDMVEKKKQYEDSLRDLERKKQEAELAAREAEKRKEAADMALAETNEKKAAFEAAAQRAEEKRLAEEQMVANIMLEIEETLKEEIEFVKNQATLTPQGEAVCQKIVPFLLRLPDMIIHIESHTNCFAGKCDRSCYLMELSQQRVDTVRSYFIKNGCKNEFLTKGWGCKHPQLHNIRLVRIFPEKSHKRTIVLPAAPV